MLLKYNSISKYTIVTAKSVAELIAEMEDALKSGFTPQGGVFTFTEDGVVWFGQAVVKK